MGHRQRDVTRSVPSGAILVSYMNFTEKRKINPDVPKYLNGLIQIIRMEKSIRHMWVKTDNSNKIQDMQLQKLT